MPDRPDPHCPRCEGCGWVCENHRTLPWDGLSKSPRACHCGGAGAPCACNPGDADDPPAVPGMQVICDANKRDRKH